VRGDMSYFNSMVFAMSIFKINNTPMLKSINEISSELNLEQHILRFWETKFPQIKPIKGRGNRRLYREEDVSTLRTIQDLLHKQGYTIEGAKKALSNLSAANNNNDNVINLNAVSEIMSELTSLKDRLQKVL
jgi:DNA-binding transcriptional MerR regulator